VAVLFWAYSDAFLSQLFALRILSWSGYLPQEVWAVFSISKRASNSGGHYFFGGLWAVLTLTHPHQRQMGPLLHALGGRTHPLSFFLGYLSVCILLGP